MTQEEFRDKLNAQIVEGEQLLSRFNNLTPIPEKKIVGVMSMPVCKNYDRMVVSNLERDLLMWVDGVRTILSSRWGKTHPQRVKRIEISKPSNWFDFKDTGIYYINKNLTELNTFVRNYSIVDDYDNTPDIDETDSCQVNQPISGDAKTTFNVSAVNANMGPGTISTGDITGNELTQQVNSELKDELRHIIDEIAKEAKALNNQVILDCAQKAQQEIEKPQCEKKTIQAWLYAINSVAAVIGNAAIQELVSQGISFLF